MLTCNYILMTDSSESKIKKIERTLALNNAADQLGFDADTRRAMTHVETLISVLEKAGMTWADVPDNFTLEKAIGESPDAMMVLETGRALDPGLVLAEQAQYDPGLRTALLAKYVQCIEVALPGERMTVEETLQSLLQREP